ncbi:MAG TPA: ATP-binding cassette domain-containing protein [Mycobacteriales bacterium]|nr:ATP-binding cassette domain-containing protein [Mycobacteriales bacterium]
MGRELTTPADLDGLPDVPDVLLDAREVSKTFGEQRALDHVSVRVRRGAVHAVVGENGSGKSTFIKILAGYHTPDHGCRITVAGQELPPGTPAESLRLGLRFVHQNLGLIAQFDAADNIGLVAGYPTGPVGRIQVRAQRRRATELLARIGVTLDLAVPVGQLRPVERSAVAVARALDDRHGEIRLLVLDEPTAALPPTEVEALFRVVRDVAAHGVSVLYVSHRLDEILALADVVSVLRDGRLQGTFPVEGLSRDQIVRHILGDALVPKLSTRPDSAPELDGATGLSGAAGLTSATGLDGAAGLNSAASVDGGSRRTDGSRVDSAPRVDSDSSVDGGSGRVDGSRVDRAAGVDSDSSVDGGSGRVDGSRVDSASRVDSDSSVDGGSGRVDGSRVDRAAGVDGGSRVDSGFRRGDLVRPALEVHSLVARYLAGVDFTVGAGEIVGVAGLDGSGRDELAGALGGAVPARGIVIDADGRTLGKLTPRAARAHGIALVLPNWHPASAVREFDVRENVSLASLRRFASGGVVRRGRERQAALDWLADVDIRPRDPAKLYGLLSGGNQQKVIVARWLATRPRVMVLDDPTSGVDVGARAQIYQLLRAQAAAGVGILLCSSDSEDLVAVCDRVLCLVAGRVAAEISGSDVAEQAVLAAISARAGGGLERPTGAA